MTLCGYCLQQAIEGNERGLTEAQREFALRRPLTRFKRNRRKPARNPATQVDSGPRHAGHDDFDAA
jgi:hypothetical protein